MNFKRFRHLLWVLVVGLLAFFYYKASEVDLEAHEEMHSALRSVREHDSRLNQSLLRSRYYLDRTYDPLNASVEGIQAALGRAGFLIEKERVEPGDQFGKHFERYQAVFESRKSNIDRFKSANSILRNSLQYLALSARRLDATSGYTTAGTSGILLRDVLLFNVNDDRQLEEQIQRQRIVGLAPLIAGGGPVGREARIFDRHIQNILTRKTEVDLLIGDIVLAEEADLAEKMLAAYSEDYLGESYRAGIYNLLLFALAGALLLYVVLIVLRLRISGWSLEVANKQLEILNRAFERFVPVEFLKHLDIQSIADIKLGEHRRTRMTVLFSDIRSFTTISETMTPEENFAFINSYLSSMGPAIRRHGGFIDKYIGDAIMALFDGSIDSAVSAGLLMLTSLRTYNEKHRGGSRAHVRIGIGIHTGDMMLGTIGEHHRMEGTVISDAVNLASRLESMTKEYSVPLLISEETFQALEKPENFQIRFIDRVNVKGKVQHVRVYEVFDADDPPVRLRKLRTVDRIPAAFAALEAGDRAGALAEIDAALEELPDDPVLLRHRELLSVVSEEAANDLT